MQKNILLVLMLTIAVACASLSPLQKESKRIQPGMSEQEVEALVGQFASSGQDVDMSDPRINPLGQVGSQAIIYPLDEEQEISRKYYSINHRGKQEHLIIDFRNGKAYSMRYLQ